MSTETSAVGTRLSVVAGPFTFAGVLEEVLAPSTCAAFKERLPFRSRVIHVRWSGQATWIPLGETDFGLGPENATAFPLPGQVLLYPGGLSETEILLPYGPTRFYSVAGELAGNHFMTITDGAQQLRELGELVLWEGARDVVFDVEKAAAVPERD